MGFQSNDKKFGFGLMRLPLTNPVDNGSVDMDETRKMIDYFMQAGFNYFDSGWMYQNGKSEKIIKAFLTDRYPRDAFRICTKLPNYKLTCLEDRDTIFEKQRERTGLDYFDYYFLHNVNTTSLKRFNAFDCFNWLSGLKAKGLAKKIGFSYHDSPEVLDVILTAYPDIDVVQIQLNYLDWNSLGVRSRQCYDVCLAHGVDVFVMEPVKGGTLAQVPEPVEAMFRKRDPRFSPAAWALRFAASLPGVKMVLSGMSNFAQLKENVDMMASFAPLTTVEKEMMLYAAQMINANIEISCTGCHYCTPDCPMGIPIPRFFALYNADVQEIKGKGWSPQGCLYDNLTLRTAKASACIKCGRCEPHCPQRLPIRDLLEKVKERFER